MIKRKSLPLAISLIMGASYAHSATFVIEKNNQSFSIDGNGGAIQGQQIYLWNTNTNNANQQWVQLDRGNGYYSYRKQDTNLCWDGGNGGSRRQAVTLETCNPNNQSQHWSKIKITAGTELYRFEKRNAPGWSIDGNGGAARLQAIYLWNSNSSNVNQQWELTRTDTGPTTPTPTPTPDSSDALFLQHEDTGVYYALNSSDQLERSANSTASAQGLEKVSKGGGFALLAVGGDMDGMYAYEPSGSNRQEMTADFSAAEVFYEYDCGGDVVYFVSATTGSSLKNESNDMLGNGSGGDCGSAANEFTWVGGSTSPTPSTPTPTPTTPTPSGGGNIPSEITNSDLWDLEGENPHPLVNSSTLEFVPLEAKVTTPNGNGWRHEYKIHTDERIPMPDYYEYFKATIRVDLSDGGKTIVAQYHAEDISTLMKLYIADSSESDIGDSNPGDGVFGVYVRMLDKDSGNEVKQALGTIRSGDTFTFESINSYGNVTVNALGRTLTTEVEDGGASYLKFGNYLQSQYPDGNEDCGEHGNSDSFAECYEDIGITTSKITMTNITYERID